MYHHFFIHLSISGHLGCFHSLAIVNNVSVNIGVPISFWISVLGFSDIYPEMDHQAFSFLIFWGMSTLFSTVAAPICIPINSAWRFPFLHILTDRSLLIDWWCHSDKPLMYIKCLVPSGPLIKVVIDWTCIMSKALHLLTRSLLQLHGEDTIITPILQIRKLIIERSRKLQKITFPEMLFYLKN